MNVFSQKVVLEKEGLKIPFKKISNLMLVKVSLNEHKNLNFLVDTGSNGIIVFDPTLFDEKKLLEGRKVPIRGWGVDSTLHAVNLKGNRLSMHSKLYSNHASVIVIKNAKLDLSSKFGVKIHGIIGNNFFRRYKLSILYSKNKLKIYKKLPKLKKYSSNPLLMNKGKPYLQFISKKENKIDSLTLLMDSGGDDALWLFENTYKNNEPFISDFLGFGLAGEVSGKRSVIRNLYYNEINFSNIYVAYPDMYFVEFIKNNVPVRYGSVGAGLLQKMDWIIDYRNKKVYSKKNRLFKKPFSYNLSGMEISSPIGLMNLFVVERVIKGSNADVAGIKKDDVLVSLNGVEANKLSLENIKGTLRNSKYKKISVTMNRNGNIYNTIILLKNQLK